MPSSSHCIALASLFLLMASTATTTGCAIFGNNLPPGRAGGTFFENAAVQPVFSKSLERQRSALDQASQAKAQSEFDVLRDLIVASASLRREVAVQRQLVLDSYKKQGEVSALDANSVRESARWFLELDALLYGMWSHYRDALPYGSEPDPYAPYRGVSLLSKDARVKAGLLALTAEVVRMENADAVIQVIGKSLALSLWLNHGDLDRGLPPEGFDRIVGSFHDPARRALLQEYLRSVATHREVVEELAHRDPSIAFLLSVLRESRTAQRLLGESAVARQLRFAWAVSKRSFAALLAPILNIYISKIISNDDANMKILPRTADIPGLADRLYERLRPLDVIVTKDARVGAGYTNAYLHLGSLAELRAAGVSSQPAVALRIGELRRGARFLELNASGIRLVPLEKTLEAQDLVVFRYQALREKDESSEKTSSQQPASSNAVLLRALSMLTQSDFVNPTKRDSSDNAALLLSTVFGPVVLGVTSQSGSSVPSLAQLLDAAFRQPQRVAFVLGTIDGDEVEQEKLPQAVKDDLRRMAHTLLETKETAPQSR